MDKNLFANKRFLTGDKVKIVRTRWVEINGERE